MLSKLYLCMDSNNSDELLVRIAAVVNCFQNCIFAWILTTLYLPKYIDPCCELLSKLYLCMDSNNADFINLAKLPVVNCFQNCIFAWILTTKCIFSISIFKL